MVLEEFRFTGATIEIKVKIDFALAHPNQHQESLHQ